MLNEQSELSSWREAVSQGFAHNVSRWYPQVYYKAQWVIPNFMNAFYTLLLSLKFEGVKRGIENHPHVILKVLYYMYAPVLSMLGSVLKFRILQLVGRYVSWYLVCLKALNSFKRFWNFLPILILRETIEIILMGSRWWTHSQVV